MTEKHPLTSEEISAIVNGINPIDWVQMELLANCRLVSEFFQR